MAKGQVPTLRKHATGQWICKWNKRVRYLGRDFEAAKIRFAAELEAWQEWRKTVEKPTVSDDGEPLSGDARFAVAAQRLLTSVRKEGGQGAANSCSQRIRFFLSRYGSKKLCDVQEDDLHAYRESVVEHYTPNIANSVLCSTRRLLTFAQRFAEKPFNLSALKSTKRKSPPLKAQSFQYVKQEIDAIALLNPNLARHMLLQFWAVMRPSEVSRLVKGEGTWLPISSKCQGKVFVPTESKMKHRGQDRMILLTPAALELLDEIREYGKQGSLRQAMPPNMSAYRQCCAKLSVYGIETSPHYLRHSAATALSVEVESTRDVVETALGHSMPQVAGRYFPPDYASALKAMAELAKLVPMPKKFAERTVTRGKDKKQRVCPPRKLLQAA